MPQNKNPSWVRDELILALELYLRHRPLKISHDHPEVVALSDLLRRLQIHLDRQNQLTFRNPNSVYMKLCNFLTLDPAYKGKGLSRGGAEDLAVWNEFSTQPTLLAQTAIAIRSWATSQSSPLLPDEDDDEFPEGRLLFRVHVSRERNPTLVRKARSRALKRDGRLVCQVCAFDFRAKYGAIGENFIECHHVVPVSRLSPGAKTRVEDIALLCSNCHRMVHRRRPWLSLLDLKMILSTVG